VRYRDAAGKPHSETKRRLVDAERRKAEIELDVGNGLWRDPRRGEIRLEKWAADWIQTRHDLRLTTRTRLEITLTHRRHTARCGPEALWMLPLHIWSHSHLSLTVRGRSSTGVVSVTDGVGHTAVSAHSLSTVVLSAPAASIAWA
jgi:hypothetical protein